MSTEGNGTGTAPVRPLLSEGLKPLLGEIRTYFRDLPRYLRAGQEGRYVLIKGDVEPTFWSTSEDAYQAGRELYGWGVPFLAQKVDAKFLKGPYPEELRDLESA